MNKTYLIAIILVIIVGAGGFFAGMKYQQSKGGRFGNFQGMRNGSPRFAGEAGQFQQRGTSLPAGRQGLRPVNGEIISTDDKSITVKMPDGSSKIILLTETVAINKSAEGSKEDLRVGERVAIFGTENSDGSLTAQNIQLNPQFRR